MFNFLFQFRHGPGTSSKFMPAPISAAAARCPAPATARGCQHSYPHSSLLSCKNPYIPLPSPGTSTHSARSNSNYQIPYLSSGYTQRRALVFSVRWTTWNAHPLTELTAALLYQLQKHDLSLSCKLVFKFLWFYTRSLKNAYILFITMLCILIELDPACDFCGFCSLSLCY